MRVYYDRGLIIEAEGLKFLLDPRSSADFHSASLVLVSHGHSDHISGLIHASENVRVGASNITHEIARSVRVERDRRFLGNTVLLDRKHCFRTDKYNILAYDAGHCMGSLQFKVDTGEHLIGYTGDLNFCESITERKADVVDCDVLVIEATFGSEEYVFPEREEIISEILAYVERNVSDGVPVVLLGYSLGKCQELTSLISKGLGYDVLVPKQIFEFNKIFERYKTGLGKYFEIESEEGREILEGNKYVLLLPPSYLGRNAPERLAKAFNLTKPPKVAICTGWAAKNSFFFSMQQAYNIDAAFPLSSHADFNQLLEYVSAVEPSTVYTTFGNPVNLAKQIKKRLKIKAQPVVNKMQQTLETYSINQEPQITLKTDANKPKTPEKAA
ncbi:MAG: MBL fold metallo-hydrolase [Candidatus Jordarchaeaceae archaeon]